MSFKTRYWLIRAERRLSVLYFKHADELFMGMVGMIVIFVIGLFCFEVYKMPLVK
jgi:hypothetical protein